MNSIKRYAMAVLAIVVLASCAKVLAPKTTNNGATSSTTVISKPGAQPDALSYPSWYVELPVPFVSQFSVPNSTKESKNCGQASGSMCDGYYRGYQPWSQTIIGVDKWLDGQFPNLGYATPNSYFTHVVAPRYALTKLVQNYYGYASYYETGATTDNLSRIFRAIAAGVPVIVSTEISNGYIVTTSATDHWCVLVGYDQGGGGQVILHNPGTSDDSVGGKGKFHHMSIADFMKTWSLSGGYWMPVEKGMCRYF